MNALRARAPSRRGRQRPRRPAYAAAVRRDSLRLVNGSSPPRAPRMARAAISPHRTRRRSLRRPRPASRGSTASRCSARSVRITDRVTDGPSAARATCCRRGTGRSLAVIAVLLLAHRRSSSRCTAGPTGVTASWRQHAAGPRSPASGDRDQDTPRARRSPTGCSSCSSCGCSTWSRCSCPGPGRGRDASGGRRSRSCTWSSWRASRCCAGSPRRTRSRSCRGACCSTGSRSRSASR